MRLDKTATLLAGCALVVLWAVYGAVAQAPEEGPGCQAIMAERARAMAEMKAADQRLDDLVAKMNAVAGADKTAAMANVLTELVAQRGAMREMAMKMQHGMMGHMMEHRQGGRHPMADCPLMKPPGDVKP